MSKNFLFCFRESYFIEDELPVFPRAQETVTNFPKVILRYRDKYKRPCHVQ